MTRRCLSKLMPERISSTSQAVRLKFRVKFRLEQDKS